MDKNLILNQIKDYLEIETSKDFAEYLGIKATTLSMWRKRNTYDAELLFKKCEFLNAETLLLGKGNILKDEKYRKNNQKKELEKGLVKRLKTKNTEKTTFLDDERYLLRRKLKYKESLVLSDTGAPFYNDLPVSAGDLHAISEKEHPKGFIDVPGLTCKAYFPVIGTSFKPLIFAGDIIGVDFIDSWEELDTDVIYYVVTNSNRMIKHLRHHDTDSNLLICSSPNHKEFTISVDEIKHIYKVLFYGRLA